MGNIDAERLLPSAFAACGIYPIDAERVCEKIVEVASAPLIARHVDEVLLNRFEVTRFGDKEKKKAPRGKKIPAGQSYSAQPEDRSSGEETDVDEPQVSRRSGKKKTSVIEDSEEESEASDVSEPSELISEASEESDGEHEELPDPERPKTSREGRSKPKTMPKKTNRWQESLAVGQYVAAVYMGEWYIAQVEGEEEEEEKQGYTLLKYMTKEGHNMFMWSKVDMLSTLHVDILMSTPAPVPTSSRGYCGYDKKVLGEVEKAFRVGVVVIIKYQC